jgi:hypothetical protein
MMTRRALEAELRLRKLPKHDSQEAVVARLGVDESGDV